MAHIVLLGDSIFDNAPYVPAGMAVADHLRACLAPHDRVTLLARDGSELDDVAAQLPGLAALYEPPTHLVLSCGGNDVLGLLGAMHGPVASVLEAVELLAAWQRDFRAAYCRMLDAVLATRLPLTVCTIYDAVPGLSPGLRTALAVFNDVIIREAASRGLALLDLRLVCTEPQDYAACSPIEPSAQGGRKIAQALAALTTK
ncbi:SGNH/GDSL hydrolase family protein [Massilia arenae]|uniref:SGNH/GDSL hydrolase family protein n=1 Tax=Massilia arenae TaxID=2603288 RepID=A0A5C7G400_9BURK|nr:GDSL-type esterase/lipase family protein [Massilia arenae]TXF97870.1 SGNH/GDSL hydrolase family protein [Massilia arenae]